MNKNKIDRVFILITALLILVGIFVFASASLGILARDQDKFISMVANQFLLGLLGGLAAFGITSSIPYKAWKRYYLHIFILSLAATALVFIPELGISHGGAVRWIYLGPFSFQPSELLKLGLVIFTAGWLSLSKDRAQSLRLGFMPFIAALAISGAIMLRQPDTGSFLIMSIAAFAVYISAGAPWKHILTVVVSAFFGLAVLVSVKPYLMDRILTFVDPTQDKLGSSYQIQQSLIAIGSGEIFGRGLGQSVQKFNYLPEPVGDSVFAVIGEETGIVGTSVVVILFLLFALRGFKIGSRAPDQFGTYLAVGLTSIIIIQAFLNVSSLIGIFPLTGVPLPFISHGGTALFFALAGAGIIANISKYSVSR